MILLVRPVMLDEGQSWNSGLEDRGPSKNSGSVKKKGINCASCASADSDEHGNPAEFSCLFSI